MKDIKIINYTTPEEQIALLKSKGLIIKNDSFVKQCLDEYGYYNIINSYKAPYLENKADKKIYISGTTFEQIYSLFVLDHNLRNSIMSAMLDLEEHLRAAAAEVIADSFGTDHREYLKWENYRDRHVVKDRFSLRSILGTLQQNLSSGKDPIKYYREKYDIVPPWILFQGTYFSTLINFIRLFKDKQKQKLLCKLYNLDNAGASLPCTKKFLSDTLFVCLDYRNRAAHGGRIYNFNSPNSNNLLNNPELFKRYPFTCDVKTHYGISQLLCLLFLFKFGSPSNIIDAALSKEINRHLNLYPQDKNFLGNIIGLEIVHEDIVWINDKSKIFHSDPACCGMKNPTQILAKNLDPKKYIPCKRCCIIKNK